MQTYFYLIGLELLLALPVIPVIWLAYVYSPNPRAWTFWSLFLAFIAFWAIAPFIVATT